MTIAFYMISAVLVFCFSGLLDMAGLGAAFIFVPLFYYLGVPLAEATPFALLLNVERAADGQLTALVEIDRDHCATCYADGIQMATGCTFGKGNIQKLGYGKFAVTLIDNKTGRNVRVLTRNETIRKSKESEFIKFRRRGVPASKIEPDLVTPLVDFILSSPIESLFLVGPVMEGKAPAGRPHDFNTIICQECGETTVERYARVKDGKIVCMPCAELF
jgi:formylmethanofuran dehydrogenase subunit E